MSCFYSKPGEYPVRNRVKNLGWLLRKARHAHIRCIEARKENCVYMGGCLRVFFDDGFIFECEFEDFEVMMHWIRSRRSWYGSILHYVVYGQNFSTVILEKV